MQKKPLPIIHVRAGPGTKTRGILVAGGLILRIALGRSGIRANKREGDGGTPRGVFHPLRLWWRADRMPRPRSFLAVRRIGPDDAWSEDPADRLYNRPFRRQDGQAGDRLRRDDHLYDLIVEIDHNTRPRVRGRGSAVFLHVARSGFGPTAGCVALETKTLRRLLAWLGPRTKIDIR